MKLFETIINMKLNRITTSELLSFSGQQGVTLSNSEAEQIVHLLKGKSINIFDEAERKIVLEQINDIVGAKRAKQIEQLFYNLTGN
jgi:chemotaxis protein CheY-P-specific phosphatase CheC